MTFGIWLQYNSVHFFPLHLCNFSSTQTVPLSSIFLKLNSSLKLWTILKFFPPLRHTDLLMVTVEILSSDMLPVLSGLGPWKAWDLDEIPPVSPWSHLHQSTLHPFFLLVGSVLTLSVPKNNDGSNP